MTEETRMSMNHPALTTKADLVMAEEWNAWGVVCDELNKLKIDINKALNLNSALVNWGNLRAKMEQ